MSLITRIPLKNFKGDIIDYALIDEDDYERVSKYKWHLLKHQTKTSTHKYAHGGPIEKQIRLHHFINGKPPKNMVTDHLDGDGLNNSKKNLRNATYKQNAQNKKQIENEKKSCKYIGVIFDKRAKKYVPRLSGKHLGYFVDEDKAAKVYDINAFLNYGKYAKTNNMIKYEEIKDLELSTKNERILPKNISMRKDNKYYAEINYKNKKYRSSYYTNINLAIN